MFCLPILQWVVVEQSCNSFSRVLVPLYDTLGAETVSYIVNQGEPLCTQAHTHTHTHTHTHRALIILKVVVITKHTKTVCVCVSHQLLPTPHQ